MRIWVILGLGACGGDAAKDSVPPGGTTNPTVTTACSGDGDCDSNEICEDAACEAGDRNNDPGTATEMFFESDQPGEINPEGDIDWYAIRSEGGEFIQVGLIPNDEEGDLDSVVSVYDDAGHRIAWEDEYAGGSVGTYDSLVYAWLPVAGTYLIKVEDVTTFTGETFTVGGENSAYTLQVSVISDGVSESDSLASVGSEQEIRGEGYFYTFPVILEEAGDTDYVLYELPYDDTWLYVYLADRVDSSELDPLVEVYNEEGELVVQKRSPTVDDVAIVPGTLGDRYVVSVTDLRGGGGDDYWGICFTQVSGDGEIDPRELEPNDSTDQATVIDLEDQEPDSGVWNQGGGLGYIDTATDVDLWAFEVDSSGRYITIALLAQQYGGLLQARIELLDSTGAVMDTVDSPVGDDEYAYNLGPYDTGTWYVRVSPVPDAVVSGGEGYFYRIVTNVSSFTFDE